MGLLAPIRHYVETLIHPSAQHDVLTAARHRAFIAPRLLGSIVALAAFPIYLLLRGAPSAIELVIVAWLVVPILTAYFLSRTGRYESAHVLSSLALTGMVTAVAALTGGIASFAAIWLVVVPLEAALSASRRVVATASTFALGAAGLLLLLGAHQVLPLPSRVWPRLPRSPHSVSCRRASMRPAWRSDRRRWRARAFGSSMPKRIVTGYWRATSPTSSRAMAATVWCCSSLLPARNCSARAVPSCTATACLIVSMSPTGRPISPRSAMPRRWVNRVRSSSAFAGRYRRRRASRTGIRLDRNALPAVPAKCRRRRTRSP